MYQFHDIGIDGYPSACVAFRGADRRVEITVSQSVFADGHTCAVGNLDHPSGLPTWFRKDVDASLVRAIVGKILSSDYVAASRFRFGKTAKLNVPVLDPRSTEGSPSTFEDIRRRAQPLGAIVRPCLVDSAADLDQLHDYQQLGVNWLVARTSAVLADDMGLGKTAQAISALRREFKTGPLNSALVICPKQLMANWEIETARWAPELSWSRLTPPVRWRTQAWKRLFNRVHVLITNYEQVGFISQLGPGARFSSLVIDEAHRVRNASAQVTSNLRNIERDRTWALTGTPLERAPSDVWTILSVVEPRRFNLTHMPQSEDSLKARARPYILRRMKQDLLALPPEVHEHEVVELLPQQRAAYDRVLDEFRSASDDGLLARLTELRSLCDLDPQSGQSAKLERIVEVLHAVAANGEKGVVFSHQLKPLDVLGQMLDRTKVPYVQLRGTQSLQEREAVLAEFKRDTSIPFLLASTRVAGEGLNIVEANHVVFVNRWWNPSSNKQAKDRVSRIGQKRTVVVHSYTCRNTIEEALDSILEEKDRLAATLIESLANPLGDSTILQELLRRF